MLKCRAELNTQLLHSTNELHSQQPKTFTNTKSPWNQILRSGSSQTSGPNYKLLQRSQSSNVRKLRRKPSARENSKRRQQSTRTLSSLSMMKTLLRRQQAPQVALGQALGVLVVMVLHRRDTFLEHQQDPVGEEGQVEVEGPVGQEA